MSSSSRQKLIEVGFVVGFVAQVVGALGLGLGVVVLVELGVVVDRDLGVRGDLGVLLDLGVRGVGVVAFVGGVALVVGFFVSFVGFVGFVAFFVGLVVDLGVDVINRRRRLGLQSPAGHRTVSTVAAGSLRWVCGLLPGDEGAAWWAEVTSLLAEAPDKSTRRRYVRSYRQNVPQLIWTSWAEHLSASRQRELL